MEDKNKTKGQLVAELTELRRRITELVTSATERKQIEEKLARIAAEQKNIMGTISDGIYMLDMSGNLVNWNKVAETVTGLSAEELTGKPIVELFAEEDRAAVAEAIRKGLEEDIGEVTGSFLRKDQSAAIYQWSTVPLKDPQGKVIGLTGVGRDITEQKRIEEELARIAAEQKNIMGTISDGIYMLDMSGNLINWNKVAETVTGLSAEELTGKPIVELFAEEDREAVAEAIRKGLEEDIGEVTGSFLRKDQSPAIYQWSTVPLKDPQGKVIGLTGVGRDITDRKQAEEALREAEETVRKKLEAVLKPDGDIGTLSLGDIIDSETLQSMMDEFYKLTNISSAMIDISGKVLVAVGWQDICTKFHRCHPDTLKNCIESDTILSNGVPAGEFKAYRCKNNLWDMVTPIEVGGKHLGNIFIGQFLYEDEIPDYGLFRSQARQYGFDEKQYLAALDRVPRLSRETVDTAMTFYAKLAGMISSLSYSTINLSRSLAQNKISLRQLAEIELKQSTMISNISDVIGIMGADGLMKYISPNIEKWFGWQPQDLVGTDGWSTVHPNDLERIQKEFFTLIEKDNSVITLECLYKCKDGSCKPIEITATNLTNDPIISGMLLNYHDITDRKQAEEESKLSKNLLRDVMNIVPTFICAKNLEGRFILVNKKLTDFYGTTVDEMTGILHADICDNEDELQGMLAADREVIESGKLKFIPEETMENPDGSITVLETHKIPFTALGEPAVLIASVDITERKQAEKEQEKLQAQLTQAQKMESVGRLAGGVAHDFNNMLGVILGRADMILEKLDPALPIYNGLKEIKKAAERSADLTRQLLAFARKQTVAPKVLDLNRTLEGMLQMLRRLLGEDIDLAWLPGKDLGPVKIDPSQIDQMLANLCVNARDAIADVGKITIETGAAVFDEDYCSEHAGFTSGEFVMLAVSDDGCGMDQETLAHIFEPFFTTKELKKGTGLGLATIYGIVKQNNGFVNVYSEPGLGTTFKIYLPRHIGKPGQMREKGSAKPDVRGHETILLVEDEPAILEIATMMLERLGYTVVAAGTPGEAIRLAREYTGQIHLLMTDVVMPEMNGRDLAKNLLSSYPNLKRLFMSGYTANVIAHHGVLDKGVNFIQKPFSIKDLGVKVREIMDKE